MWSESDENHRPSTAAIYWHHDEEKALSWWSSRKSSILILNCNESTDGGESPMTAFEDYQANQATALTPAESLVVRFWGYKNPGLKPRGILVWLIGDILESSNSDLTLHIDETDPVLMDVLEQVILSLLRKYRILLVLDGLGYFESESSSEDVEVESNKKRKGETKSKAVTKSEPSKKANAKATKTSQELNESSELNAKENSEAGTAHGLLEKLVNTLMALPNEIWDLDITR